MGLREILEELWYKGHNEGTYGDSGDPHIDTDSAIQAIRELVPKAKSEDDCECGGVKPIAWEGCGCKVDDFNECREEMLRRMQ